MSSNSLTRRLFWLAGSLVVAVGCVGVRPARARFAPKAAVPSNATYTPGTFRSGEIEILMANGASPAPVAAAIGATKITPIAYSKNAYLLTVPVGDGAMVGAVQA